MQILFILPWLSKELIIPKLYHFLLLNKSLVIIGDKEEYKEIF